MFALNFIPYKYWNIKMSGYGLDDWGSISGGPSIYLLFPYDGGRRHFPQQLSGWNLKKTNRLRLAPSLKKRGA
jgi:hypothetical protein